MSKAKKKIKRLKRELREADALARELGEELSDGELRARGGVVPSLAPMFPPPGWQGGATYSPDAMTEPLTLDSQRQAEYAATQKDRLIESLARERRDARHALAWHVERLGDGDRDWGELLDEWRAATGADAPPAPPPPYVGGFQAAPDRLFSRELRACADPRTHVGHPWDSLATGGERHAYWCDGIARDGSRPYQIQ